MREEGAASAEVSLVAVTPLAARVTQRAKLSRLPAESKPGRNASLTVILLLSCSRARKYYW